MKHLYDCLRGCAKEEEVKAEFCKFFKMKIFALRLLSLLGDSEVLSFGGDFKNPPNLLDAQTPSSESNEYSVPLRLCVKNNPAIALRTAHDALRAKLLPQVYTLGFLNPDVDYFK